MVDQREYIFEFGENQQRRSCFMVCNHWNVFTESQWRIHNYPIMGVDHTRAEIKIKNNVLVDPCMEKEC